MKNIFTRRLLSAIVLAGVLVTLIGIQAAVPVSATAPTTSLTITKYAADRTTVIAQVTVSATDMAAGQATGSDSQVHSLPVRGDGITHYFTQGPSFVPTNLWDPGETLNLKDKGALKGTAIKDLCELVGGVETGGTVEVCAADNYGNTEFPYANIYNTLSDPLNARQGKMTICWYNQDPGGDDAVPGGLVPTWTNGMLLAFFAETTNAAGQHVFGNQDMHDCLPETDWHFYTEGAVTYPSVNGGYIKWVNRLNIYSSPAAGWSVALHGARDQGMDRMWFENALSSNCHGTTIYDDQGNVWSGLPLWYACGIVDDMNIHGPGAFNDNLYYDVKVTGGEDNYSYTFPSTTVARNNYIILADKLNGQEFSPTYHPEYYPLKLVSSTFINGGPSVAQISSIDLLNISTTPPVEPTPTPGEAEWPLVLKGTLTENLSKEQFQSCIDCHGATTYVDGPNIWSGLPLRMLAARVDDANKHGENAFNVAQAAQNYPIKVYAADGYNYTFYSTDVALQDEGIIVANKLNGQPLPETIISGDPPSEHPAYPLKITGPSTSSGSRIGAMVKIELTLPRPAWDLNNDHVCNVGDIVALGLHWGNTGAAGWIPEDLNNDGVINVGDVVVLGRHWNQTW